MADDSIISYSDLIGDDGTFDDILKNIKKIEKELISSAKRIKKEFSIVNPNDTERVKQLEKEVTELTQANKNLAKATDTVNKAKKKSAELTQEQLIQQQALKLQRQEANRIAKQQAIILKEEGNTIKSLRAQLSLATIQWSKLTAEELKNTNKGKQLVATKKQLTNQLKALEKATGDARRNVGNYTSALGRLGKTAQAVFLGRSIVDGIRRVSTFFSGLIEKAKDSNDEIKALDSSLGRAGRAIQTAGTKLLSFFAPAIIKAVDGLTWLLDTLTGTNSGVKEFSATSDQLKGKIDGLTNEFSKEIAAVDQLFTSLENTNEQSQERVDLINKINDQYGQYLPNLLTEKSTLQEIEQAQRLVNEALTKGFLLRIQQETQTDIFNKKARQIIDNFNEIKQRVKDSGLSITGSLSDFQSFGEELSRNWIAAQAFANIISDVGDVTGESKKVLNSINPEFKNLAVQLSLAEKNGADVVDLFKALVKDTNEYNKAIEDTQTEINDLNESTETYNKKTEKSTKTTTDNTKSIEERIKAIEALQREVKKLEAENIEDAQKKAIELENLRFSEQRRLQTEQLEKLRKDFEGNKEKEQLINDLAQQQAEQSYEKHQQNLQDITQEYLQKRFEAKRAERQKERDAEAKEEQDRKAANLKRLEERRAARKKQQEEDEAARKKQQEEDEAARKAALEKQKEEQQQLIEQIGQTAEKIGQEIVNLLEKQADVAQENVETQVDNLDRARERAANGLESNLAFEEQELARRQAEQQRAQKQAEQAAKLLTLFNLVSAYAQSGDENALFRGLADFAILEAFSAGLTGFYEGTEDTGTVAHALDSKGGRLAVLHDNERVMTKAQNLLLNGMSNEQVVQNALIGEQMGDYFNPQGITQRNLFEKQKEDFIKSMQGGASGDSDSALIKEVRQLRREMSKQPNFSVELEKIYNDMYGLVQKEVRRGMKVVTKQKLRKRF